MNALDANVNTATHDELGSLLLPGEEDVPERTQDVARALDRLDVRATFSRNPPAASCRHAAGVRRSGGGVGIPVQRELKSRFLQIRPRSQRAFVLVHCRGDQRVMVHALRDALGLDSNLREATERHLAEFGASRGTVNPFEPWSGASSLAAGSALQVFDSGLVDVSVEETMMTNAGDVTWAVEVSIASYVRALLEDTVSGGERPVVLAIAASAPIDS